MSPRVYTAYTPDHHLDQLLYDSKLRLTVLTSKLNRIKDEFEAEERTHSELVRAQAARAKGLESTTVEPTPVRRTRLGRTS